MSDDPGGFIPDTATDDQAEAIRKALDAAVSAKRALPEVWDAQASEKRSRTIVGLVDALREAGSKAPQADAARALCVSRTIVSRHVRAVRVKYWRPVNPEWAGGADER